MVNQSITRLDINMLQEALVIDSVNPFLQSSDRMEDRCLMHVLLEESHIKQASMHITTTKVVNPIYQEKCECGSQVIDTEDTRQHLHAAGGDTNSQSLHLAFNQTKHSICKEIGFEIIRGNSSLRVQGVRGRALGSPSHLREHRKANVQP